MTNAEQRVGLYGIGHFGYAMLRHLEHQLRDRSNLRAYDRSPVIRDTIQNERRHPYYTTETPLDPAVRIVDSVDALLDDLDVLVLAVTSHSTREVTQAIADARWTGPLTIVNTAKALDYKTGRALSVIIAEILDPPPHPYRYVALAGGTIASELLRQNPLGMTLAAKDRGVLAQVKSLFASSSMWVQFTTDLVGVEYAGAFKNVIAIAAGMARGMGLSYGSETHLISRMANEVETFCTQRLGAARETFGIGSQCWGSDLWMSCTGNTRNRALGELLGQGQTLEEANAIMAQQHKTVEGVQTLRALKAFLEEYPQDLRLVRIVDRVVLHDAPPQALMDALMEDDDY